MSTTKPISGRSTEELDAELERHSRNERSATWLVVLALIFEAAVLWAYRRDAEAILLILADLAIAAGVYGEIRSDRKAKSVSAELDRRSKERVAEAERRSAEANQKTEEARLELEKYKAPRILNAEQIGRIAKVVSPFFGTEFIATVSHMHPEIIEFIESVISALEMAAWKQFDAPHPGVRRNIDKPFIGTGAKNSNVLVIVASAHPAAARTVQAGKALVEALIAEGVATTFDVWDEQPTKAILSAVIDVLIGPKA